MRKIFTFLLPCLLAGSFCHAQKSPSIVWQKSLGGSDNDFGAFVQQTTDGGLIVAGFSSSTNGDVTGNHGAEDFWVVKMMGANIQWQHSYGGSGSDMAACVQQTKDGGYIVVGSSDSHDGDVTLNQGNTDCWVIKLSATGVLQWQKSFGGSGADGARFVQQTPDGGYILACITSSPDGDVTGFHGKYDYWIVKLSDTGAIEWQKAMGGTEVDQPSCIRLTPDGGYIVAGKSNSSNKDVTGNHGLEDFWIVKLSSAGSIEWQRSIGGHGDDEACSILTTPDGGYVVAGKSNSIDGNMAGGFGDYDYRIFKLSSTGDIVWTQFFGGTGSDVPYCLQPAGTGFILCGSSNSINGCITDYVGGNDYWVLRISGAGDIQWQKSLGSYSDLDNAAWMQQTSDGGFVVAGYTSENSGDVTGNHGSSDFWVVQLSQESLTPAVQNTPAISIFPNPTTGDIFINGATGNITIYNALGSLIVTAIAARGVSLQNQPPGLYFVRVTGDAGDLLYSGSVVKE